jgi:3-oxoacyl-[acyl-carrier-protein] synthase-3
MTLRAVIKGVGSCLPANKVMNADLAKRGVNTSDEWITQRTGIKQRYIAETEKTSDLALGAAQAALKHAGITVDDVDAIILATTTPDETFPSTATQVQTRLGMTRGFAFDVQAVCSGFVYALSIADSMIRGGTAKTIIVIGAETMSRILDWSDRGTCVLFGDGAGAVVVQGEEGERGILGSQLFSDGSKRDLLYATGGAGSADPAHIKMQGREVFRHAVDHMAGVVKSTLEQHKLTTKDVDWLVPHQANIRILESTAEKLEMPLEKVIITVDQHGNTSAASIPLALAEGVKQGKFREGQLLVLEALGGGFTWGAVLLRW